MTYTIQWRKKLNNRVVATQNAVQINDWCGLTYDYMVSEAVRMCSPDEYVEVIENETGNLVHTNK